jgi:hypothetical protein
MPSRPPILRLPYDASLTVAGIEYAKKSLHHTYNRMRLGTGSRLRKIVSGVAVELSFRRWLAAQGVRYDLLGATPFTEPDRYDLRLGGRRCDVKSFLVSDRPKISALRRDPAELYAAVALVPEDQFHSDSMGESDIYLFGFLAGLETRGAGALQRALAAEQPVCLLHTFEHAGWRGVEKWQSLGRLLLKADGRAPVELEVGGQDRDRAILSERLHLSPRTRTATAAEYYALHYLHAPRLPADTIGVRSPARRETRLVRPGDWDNIWVYGLEVFLAGWLTKGELRQKSRRLPAGAPVWQYPRTQTNNRAVSVAALRPVTELADRVRRATGPGRP